MTGSDMDWSLLDRYLSGRCSPEEVEVIQRWARSDPSDAHLLDAVQQIWDAAGVIPERFNPDAAVRAMRMARANVEVQRERRAGERGSDGRAHTATVIQLPLPHRRSGHHHPSRSSARRRATPLVAAALLVMAASVAMWQQPWRWLARDTASSVIPMREYATTRGQRAEVMLTDGTRVWLSVDSRLRVPVDYGTETRTVYLDGAAYFEVEHDARRPFLVHANGAIAEDLGTRFLVHAYPDDSGTAVVVAEGSVALRPETPRPGRGVALTPGQRGELDPSGFVTVTPNVDVEAYLAWRRGHLELRRVPLVEAIRVLERWYDITITLSDSSLAQVSVTASFGEAMVDDALGILTQTLGIRYARQGTQVRLLSDSTP